MTHIESLVAAMERHGLDTVQRTWNGAKKPKTLQRLPVENLLRDAEAYLAERGLDFALSLDTNSPWIAKWWAETDLGSESVGAAYEPDETTARILAATAALNALHEEAAGAAKGMGE